MFRQLLHDLCEIYRRKEIPPREVRQEIYLLFMFLPVRQNGRFNYRVSRGFEYVIFGAQGRWVVREM